jgi:hypothetical protein
MQEKQIVDGLIESYIIGRCDSNKPDAIDPSAFYIHVKYYGKKDRVSGEPTFYGPFHDSDQLVSIVQLVDFRNSKMVEKDPALKFMLTNIILGRGLDSVVRADDIVSPRRLISETLELGASEDCYLEKALKRAIELYKPIC